MKLILITLASLFALGMLAGCGEKAPETGKGETTDPVHEAVRNNPRSREDAKAGVSKQQPKQPMGEPPKTGN